MKIAEVSKRYGLSADTLRYYERIGLLPGVTRNASGIRDYSEQDCARVEFVKCMRAASVSIEALIEYMDLFEQGAADGRDVLDVTGQDVAAFCDDLLAGAKTYRGTKQDALNRAIMGKLGNGRA